MEVLGKSIERVMAKCDDPRLASRAFWAQANLLRGAVEHHRAFWERMKEFHDRSGQA